MKLQETIDEALRLTADLHTAISENDLTACAALLTSRGKAMEAFATCHASSSATGKEACASALEALQQADQVLQELAAAAYDTAAKERCANLGKAPSPRHQYDRSPENACLDRKA